MPGEVTYFKITVRLNEESWLLQTESNGRLGSVGSLVDSVDQRFVLETGD